MSNYVSSHTGIQIDTCISTYQNAQQVQAAINAAKLEIFPIGSIYISTTDTNPSTFIGGTWVAFAQGRTLIGVGTGTDSAGLDRTFTSGATNGEYEHTLSIAEMPAHKHNFRNQYGATGPNLYGALSNINGSSNIFLAPYHAYNGSDNNLTQLDAGGAAVTTIYLLILRFICGNERRKSPQGGER